MRIVKVAAALPWRILVAALAVIWLTSTAAFGQGIVAGSISGSVVDPQGAAVVGAKIVAKDPTTNREFWAETNNAGLYRISGVPVGTYSVTVAASQFATVTLNNISVNANRESALAATQLKVGQESVSVTVEDAAPIVESTTSQIAKSFDTRQFGDIPVMDGNFDRLALLVPGVARVGDNGFSNSGGAVLSVNGQRGRSNNFQIDGQSNNDNSVAGPQYTVNNPDVIAEFQIVTNNFSAEYGRNMGSVVNYITKQGTNTFHGSVFEFYTGNFADAKINEERSGVFGFCEPGQALGTVTQFTGPGGCTRATIPRFVDNRFGGSLGGPIWKDKAWFFGSYVNQRRRETQSPYISTTLVPTPAGEAALAAAFGNNPAVTALQSFGPYAVTAGNPTATGNLVPLNISNGTSSTLVEFANVQRSLPALMNAEQWTVRGDWQISGKDRLFARYLNDDTVNTNATGTARGAVGAVVDVPSLTRQIGLDYTRTWTNNFIMQLRTSYSRADIGFEGGPLDCLRDSVLACNSSIQFAGTNTLNTPFGLANNLPQGRLVNVTQYQNNNTWIIGRHSLKFGGEYSRQRSPNSFLPSINGTFTFRGAGANSSCGTLTGVETVASWNASYPTGGPISAAQAAATACAFSNFVGNRPAQLQLTDGTYDFNFKEQDLAFYFQDDWRIKDNLTINLGVRWEWNEQAVNLLHDLSTRQQTGPNPFWNTTLPLDRTTVPQVPEDLTNFGPNVGFAYTPRIWKSLFGEDKTVIRGGFRVAYDPSFYNIFLNMATSAPVVNAGNIVGLGVAPGMPTAAPSGDSLRAAGVLALIPTGTDPGLRSQTRVAPDFHNPYAEQWSFGVQREIRRGLAYEIRYVGNHTVGNFQSINGNPAVTNLAATFPNVVPAGYSPCTTTGAPGIGRPDCNRGVVRVRTNGAFSIYHGMQQELRVQNWHGLTAGFSHTWSKTIDNASEIFGTIAGGNTVAFAANPFDPSHNERAVTGTSYPHVLSLYYVYDLPFYRDQKGWVGKLLGGWQWNGTWSYTSGQPYTPVHFNGGSTFCDATMGTTFSSAIETCRPFVSNWDAPIDTVGQCTDRTLSDCGLVDFYTGNPISASAVRMIVNDDESAVFFGNPFGNFPRNGVRGQTFNQTNMAVFKNTKITERVTLQLQANMANVFNRQFRGNPDPLIDDGNFANDGSFGNNFFSVASPTPTSNRRRLILGAKITF